MSFHWSFRFTPFEPRQIPDENQLFESIRRKESELCDALWLLGWLYTQTGRQPEALQVAKRILALARPRDEGLVLPGDGLGYGANGGLSGRDHLLF